MSTITVRGIGDLTGRTRRTVCRWQRYDDFPEPVAKGDTGALLFDKWLVLNWLADQLIWDDAIEYPTGRKKRRPEIVRTHCIHDHDLAVVGTKLDQRGIEQCRACRREAQRRYRANRRLRRAVIAA